MSDQKKKALQMLQAQSRTFIETISGLREISRKLVPQADELYGGNSFYTTILSRISQRIPNDLMQSYYATMIKATPIVMMMVQDRSNGILDEDMEKAVADSGDDGELEEFDTYLMVAEEDRDAIRSPVEQLIANGATCHLKTYKSERRLKIVIDEPRLAHAFHAILDEAHGLMDVPEHGEMLRRSLLTTLVGSFEYLVAAIRRVQLTSFPSSLGSTDGDKISLSEILSFGTIQEAVDAAIDKRVEAFMRESFDEWMQWLEKGPLRIGLARLFIDEEETREIFLRRNVVVHNNGKASRLYLSRWPTFQP